MLTHLHFVHDKFLSLSELCPPRLDKLRCLTYFRPPVP